MSVPLETLGVEIAAEPTLFTVDGSKFEAFRIGGSAVDAVLGKLRPRIPYTMPPDPNGMSIIDDDGNIAPDAKGTRTLADAANEAAGLYELLEQQVCPEGLARLEPLVKIEFVSVSSRAMFGHPEDTIFGLGGLNVTKTLSRYLHEGLFTRVFNSTNMTTQQAEL